MKPRDDERATFSLALTIVGMLFTVAGIVMVRAGGGAGIVGLLLVMFGLGGVLQAILVRIGFVPMPGPKRDREDRE